MPAMKKFVAFLAIISVLIGCNSGLWSGDKNETFTFYPGQVLDGEWWRLFTCVWVHVSNYHLILDGAAFLILFFSLRSTFGLRLLQVQACSIGSVLAAWWLAPEIQTLGLCGLSGVAHGLMVLLGFEMLLTAQSKSTKLLGCSLVVGTFAKCLLELGIGPGVFEWHQGNVGTPIPECHLGGAVAGLFCGFTLREPSEESKEIRNTFHGN